MDALAQPSLPNNQCSLDITLYFINQIKYHITKENVNYALEDEFHFLLECPLYYDRRKLLIDKYYWKHPNMIKFIDVYFAQITYNLWVRVIDSRSWLGLVRKYNTGILLIP